MGARRVQFGAVRCACATLFFGALAAIALVPRDAEAQARIRLRGSAHIDAHGARADGEELLLEGTLRDDAGAALANELVSVTIARASTPAQAVAYGDDRRAPRSCEDGTRDPKPNAGALPLKSDESGRFCVRVPLPLDRYVAHLAWGGSALVDGVKLDLPIDLSRRALVLTFDPEPHVVWITGSPAPVVEALASIEDNGARAVASDIRLTLSNERGTSIGTAATNGSGRARFAIDAVQLGPPGRGELRVKFAGNADTQPATHVTEIERHTRVELTVPSAEGDALKPGAPEEGVSFVVAAKSPNGDVPSGSVEARVAGQLVGAGIIEHGEANVVVTFADSASAHAAGAPPEATIELRYAPSAPWYEPSAPITVRLPIRGASPWRQVPLVLAGLAVAAWFILGRSLRAREAAHVAPRAKPPSKGEAKIDVVRVARDPRTGWSGRVVDAHDGEPIAGARMTIQRAGFTAKEDVARCVTGPDGRFALHLPTEARPNDELCVEAPLHAEIRKALPPSGELEIALVLRKRALLARLVAWAKQRGKPFDAKPEPTPAHVRKGAGKDFALVRWADAVERAAFAGGPIDAQAEAEVEKLAPPPVAAFTGGSPVEHLAKLPPPPTLPSAPRPSEGPDDPKKPA